MSYLFKIAQKGIEKKKVKSSKSWLWNLQVNTASWMVMISDTLITFKSLNKGLECSVKLEKVVILMAFFCNLNKGYKVD